jgi:hypothetical protein
LRDQDEPQHCDTTRHHHDTLITSISRVRRLEEGSNTDGEESAEGSDGSSTGSGDGSGLLGVSGLLRVLGLLGHLGLLRVLGLLGHLRLLGVLGLLGGLDGGGDGAGAVGDGDVGGLGNGDGGVTVDDLSGLRAVGGVAGHDLGGVVRLLDGGGGVAVGGDSSTDEASEDSGTHLD